jgi:hypothetical protein
VSRSRTRRCSARSRRGRWRRRAPVVGAHVERPEGEVVASRRPARSRRAAPAPGRAGHPRLERRRGGGQGERTGSGRHPAVHRVLAALGGAGEPPPRALAHRHRQVGLEHPALDLLEEALLELGGVGQRRRGVGVLGLEVGDDRRIVACRAARRRGRRRCRRGGCAPPVAARRSAGRWASASGRGSGWSRGRGYGPTTAAPPRRSAPGASTHTGCGSVRPERRGCRPVGRTGRVHPHGMWVSAPRAAGGSAGGYLMTTALGGLATPRGRLSGAEVKKPT